MGTYLRVELRSHYTVMAISAISITICAALTSVFPDITALEIALGFQQMLSWSFLAAYVGWHIFRTIWVCNDHLAVSPVSNLTFAVIRRAGLLALILFAYFLLSTGLSALAGGGLSGQWLYVLAARAISIVSYLAIVAGLSYAVKVIPMPSLAISVAVTAYVAMSIAQGLLIWFIAAEPSWHWSIGLTGEPTSPNIFVNLVPFSVEDHAWENAASKFATTSFALNAISTLFSVLVCALVQKRFRVNFYQRAIAH